MPSGFLGRLPAERPILATGMLSLGLGALAMLGVRHGGGGLSGDLAYQLAVSILIVIAVPVVFAAIAPASGFARATFLILTVAIGSGATALSLGWVGPPTPTFSPVLVGSAFGFFLFLMALSPLIRNALWLGLLAPFATLLGLLGGVGFLALQDLIVSPFNGAVVAIATAGGICVGVGIGADFAQHFAKGMGPRAAAAAAGHSALAPAAFSVLTAAAYSIIVTLQTNFGAIDWRVFTSTGAVMLLAVVTSMVTVTAALALLPTNEQIAVDENRRRQNFVQIWRPMRNLLPATTALAGLAIAGVLVVIAAFEVGIQMPLDLALFIGLILIASGLSFVSVRSSLLIAAILFISTVFAGYVYALAGFTQPVLADKFVALSVAAISVAQLTVSWRNAGDIWRNARDIAQNAMSDGLRRYLIALGVGAASIVASAYAFDWQAGLQTASYFAIVSGIGGLLSPVLMIALSARTQQYLKLVPY